MWVDGGVGSGVGVCWWLEGDMDEVNNVYIYKFTKIIIL